MIVPLLLAALVAGSLVYCALTVLAAVETLGLKLDARKAPLEMLVVDSISRTPSEN